MNKSLAEKVLDGLVSNELVTPLDDAQIVVKSCGSKLRMTRCFYDRSLRLWTAYRIDEDGNQSADTEYDITKGGAAWLAAQNEEYK